MLMDIQILFLVLLACQHKMGARPPDASGRNVLLPSVHFIGMYPDGRQQESDPFVSAGC